MSATSSSSADSRPLHIYRIPASRKRANTDHHYKSVPVVRSPSPETTVFVSRRRHSPPTTSTVRIVEVQSPSPPPTTVIKRYYPPATKTRIIRQRSPLSTPPPSESTLSFSSPLSYPIPLVKRRRQEQRVIRIATTPTSGSSNADLIVPIAKKSRRLVSDTPIAIVSETPLVNRGTSPRKQWKKRDKTIPLDLERDVYISDDDYYLETFPDGTYKPKSYKFCKWCHGKCARRFPHCNFCEWYYSCPLCCWISCLLLTLGLLIGIFVMLGFLPETNPSRRPIITQEVNTTINAVQQNLPCDLNPVFNASSTLVRCIDTTPVYIYNVVAQSFSRAPALWQQFDFKIFTIIFALLLFILSNEILS